MTPPSARPLRFGIISFAHMHATSYARCIQANPDTELVAVADPDAERGQTWAGRFGVPLYADHRELLARMSGMEKRAGLRPPLDARYATTGFTFRHAPRMAGHPDMALNLLGFAGRIAPTLGSELMACRGAFHVAAQ